MNKIERPRKKYYVSATTRVCIPKSRVYLRVLQNKVNLKKKHLRTRINNYIRNLDVGYEFQAFSEVKSYQWLLYPSVGFEIQWLQPVPVNIQ